MEKRYQVFVSSTFTDLIDERRAVMQALLELDCIPAGMELFPASDDDAWTLIKRVIDDCDYYLVILAGRYGSMDSEGISYTEKEYDYAVATGKPVLGFLHADPDSIPAKYTDHDSKVRERLVAFRAKVRKKHCRFWSTPHELGTLLTTSYVRLIRTHPAEGWVKSRYLKTTEDAEKVTSLLEQLRAVEKELEALRKLGVADTSGLAQGEDRVQLSFKDDVVVETTWNQVFAVVGRACLELPSDDGIAQALQESWESEAKDSATEECVEMLKVQFFSLGLIRIRAMVEPSRTPTEVRSLGSVTYSSPSSFLVRRWELTDYGRVKFGELAGIKHPEM
jgi:hypothetical protein